MEQQMMEKLMGKLVGCPLPWYTSRTTADRLEAEIFCCIIGYKGPIYGSWRVRVMPLLGAGSWWVSTESLRMVDPAEIDVLPGAWVQRLKDRILETLFGKGALK